MRDYSNSEVEFAISEFIHKQRDRMILHRRLIDGIGYETIAEEMDMSVSQIKRIIYKGTETIFSRI